MRISDVAARMMLLRLESRGHCLMLPPEVPLADHLALLRDHIELCERVAELEARLAAASSPPPPPSSSG